MTDPLSTPEPAVDGAAFDRKQREYARRAEELRAANKAVLFDALAAVGIDTWESSEIERQSRTVQEVVEALVYDFLRQTHSGWEIGEGANGDFTFDVAERAIKLDYNERYTSSENHIHEF